MAYILKEIQEFGHRNGRSRAPQKVWYPLSSIEAKHLWSLQTNSPGRLHFLMPQTYSSNIPKGE